MKRTPLRKVSPRRRERSDKPGKLGRIRLTGKALTKLRAECYVYSGATCAECNVTVYWEPRFAGDPEAYDMAHIQSRGAGGSDTLDNVRCLCHRCHMKEHAGKLPTNRTESAQESSEGRK